MATPTVIKNWFQLSYLKKKLNGKIKEKIFMDFSGKTIYTYANVSKYTRRTVADIKIRI